MLSIALVWALISAAAFTASLNYGMRRLAWGRIASFLELRDRVAYLERQVEEEREVA